MRTIKNLSKLNGRVYVYLVLPMQKSVNNDFKYIVVYVYELVFVNVTNSKHILCSTFHNQLAPY